jgi:Transposase DNA-binding/Transposase DDE domain
MESQQIKEFGLTHFGGAALGDERRSKRLVTVAEQVMQHPEGTWPDKLPDPADLDAFYRLVNRPEVTHAAVLGPHRAETQARMRAATDTVLILHDTTELDYSGLTIDLGPIGGGYNHGYLCHNSLAVTARGEVLGLANQILFRRPRVTKKEKKADSARRHDRESRLWKRGSEAIAPAPEEKLWVDVADRGADITEFLAYEIAHHKHFVVRSKSNRRVLLDAEKPGGKPERAKLHDLVRQLPEQGRQALHVPSGPGRSPRDTEVAIAFVKLQIRPPREARGEYSRALLTVWAVRVWEPNPPADVEPLEWVLLTNVAVNHEADAWERVAWYKRRWILEDYHKTLKSGCSIEDMQFTSDGALQPAIAIVSVVAVGLLWLRGVSRTPEAHTRQARERFPEIMIRVLSAWRYRKQPPRLDMTVYEFCYALARLGGHQNRKHDGPPGVIVLWRGWTKLQLMTAGASATLAAECGET